MTLREKILDLLSGRKIAHVELMAMELARERTVRDALSKLSAEGLIVGEMKAWDDGVVRKTWGLVEATTTTEASGEQATQQGEAGGEAVAVEGERGVGADAEAGASSGASGAVPAEDAGVGSARLDTEVTDAELVTAAQLAQEDRERELLARLTDVATLSDLPLFSPIPQRRMTSPSEGVALLRRSVFATVRSAAKAKIKSRVFYLDAETGRLVSAQVVVAYESTSYLLQAALGLYLSSLVGQRYNAPICAGVVCTTLAALLHPSKLAVTVTVPETGEVGADSYEGNEAPVYNLLEETLRLHLALAVPEAVERLRVKGGPSKLEQEKASETARGLLLSVLDESVPVSGPNSRLPEIVEAVAAAAFTREGFRYFGLAFGPEKTPDPQMELC